MKYVPVQTRDEHLLCGSRQTKIYNTHGRRKHCFIHISTNSQRISDCSSSVRFKRLQCICFVFPLTSPVSCRWTNSTTPPRAGRLPIYRHPVEVTHRSLADRTPREQFKRRSYPPLRKPPSALEATRVGPGKPQSDVRIPCIGVKCSAYLVCDLQLKSSVQLRAVNMNERICV